MQNDTLVEWQRLSEVYAGMYDDELLNLAADSADLTDTARQVLEIEMKKRGLALPRATDATRAMLQPMKERRAALRTDSSAPPKPVPEMTEDGDETGGPVEYTWKTELCECETSEQAQELLDALKKVGLDAWIEAGSTGRRFGLVYPRVLVAADQLDKAREIAANSIPNEVNKEEKEEASEFESPLCPKCGASEPTLEGVDPFNTWRCEACGSEWTESEEDLASSQGDEEQSVAKNGKSRPATGQLNPQGE
jgi:ribosomal protein L37AE/L43A